MSTTRTLVAVLASCLLAACDVVPTGDARLAWFPAKLSGDIALDASGGGLNLDDVRTDVGDDLGIGTSDSFIIGSDISTMFGNVSASYFRYSDAGSGTLNSAFGDIPPGTVVESDVVMDNLKAFWSFDLIDAAGVRIAPGIGVDMFLIDATVRSVTALSAYEQLNVEIPMPMLFLEGEVEIGPVDAELELGWMSLDAGSYDATIADIDARVVYSDLGAFEVFGGYRWISIEADGKADGQRFDTNLELAGFYFGGGVHF